MHSAAAQIIHNYTTVEPRLTTTSEEQPHTIKRPRTQVQIEITMTSVNQCKATSQERLPLYSV